MEPVTHFLFGACLSRAGFNRKTGLATLTLVLACEAPDIDAVSYLGGSVSGLQHHRGITHSFFGAPFVAALVIAVVYGIYSLMKARGSPPRTAPNWKLLYCYAVLGCLTHILLDFSNNYGVRPFEPFSYKWHSWDIFFIIDPVVIGLLALGLMVPAFMKLITDEIGARKQQFRGRGAAIFALLCIAALAALRDFEHRRAVNAMESLSYHNELPLHVSAFPTMMNPFSWHGIVETRDFLEALPVDSAKGAVDPDNLGIHRYKPEETPATMAAKKSRMGQVYLDWAQYPFVESTRLPNDQGYVVQFQDWRFSHDAITLGRTAAPLSGYVVLGPDLQIEDMRVGMRPK